jgi:hypothetical protein
MLSCVDGRDQMGQSRGFAINQTPVGMTTKQDIVMADSLPEPQDPNDYSDLLQTHHSDAFAFSEAEKLALELYDQLRELELQQSLLHAQHDGTYVSTCAWTWILSNLLQLHCLTFRIFQMTKCKSS